MISHVAAFAAGCAAAVAVRSAIPKVLLAKLKRDLDALNAGDPGPLLAGYADDAVLVFHEGDHRWSGEHRGKDAIERFLRSFIAAGLKGELRELYVAGPPWRTTLIARFDDRATGKDGGEIYRNRAVLIGRARWGRIVRHEDFFEDTGRIEKLEARLSDRGI